MVLVLGVGLVSVINNSEMVIFYMARIIQAVPKKDFVLGANSSSFVPLVTGTTPANPIIKKREEKTDRNLLQIYLDDFLYFGLVIQTMDNPSRPRMKLRRASALLSSKIDSLGGMAAAW